MCEKCMSKVKAKSFGMPECKICGRDFMCDHFPLNKICITCADKKGVCEMCGEKD